MFNFTLPFHIFPYFLQLKFELFIYLIVPFCYASAAYQVRLVEPWFVRLAKIPVARPNEPDIPKSGDIRAISGQCLDTVGDQDSGVCF